MIGTDLSDTTHRLSKADVLALVRALPDWSRDEDDDPAWVWPVEAVGLSPKGEDLPESVVHQVNTLDIEDDRPVEVSVADIRFTAQSSLRLDALAHYVTAGQFDLFDRDGWYGNDHPVLAAWPDGTYQVLDGCHRTGAAKLRGDDTILAHVIHPG